jgi:hypothetical protein
MESTTEQWHFQLRSKWSLAKRFESTEFKITNYFLYKIYSIFSPTFQLPMVQMNRVVLTFGGVSVVLCVLINVLTLFAYRQKRKTLASCREFKVENKITVFTVCTFASQSAVFLLGVQKF